MVVGNLTPIRVDLYAALILRSKAELLYYFSFNIRGNYWAITPDRNSYPEYFIAMRLQ